MDISVFYSPTGERGAQQRRREAGARAVCLGCPVRAQCRQFALALGERHGVWGGLTESEREEITQQSRAVTLAG
ncbi:WhiB family redox-sensing transcriptional regulator [Streptacidiphilus sp. MAP12-16]